MDTLQEYDSVIGICRNIFINKMHDYGTAWRILRMPSVTDQIFIKANRIRYIEEHGTSKVNEGIESEFIAIANYALMALIQLQLGSTDEETSHAKITNLYDGYFQQAKALMADKNNDYDEAWRHMRISSYTDLILMKINRTKQIEDNKGDTLVSEGVDANYFDMINYAVFALIRLCVEKEK